MGFRRLTDNYGILKCATNIALRQLAGHSASVVMDPSIQRSHRSSICEDLATGIVMVTPEVTLMLFRLRKSVLYALT